jgi:hypothetical protein
VTKEGGFEVGRATMPLKLVQEKSVLGLLVVTVRQVTIRESLGL